MAPKKVKGTSVEPIAQLPVEGEEAAAAAPVAAEAPAADAAEAVNGFESAASLTEHDLEEFWAPKELLAEEERLHHEREEAEKQADAAAAAGATALDNKKFQALEALLNQSEMYTQFLAEQMQTIEHQTEQEAKRAAHAKLDANEASSKGGRGKTQKDGPAAKKAKTGLTPTQELLPMLTVELRDYQLKGVKWLISLFQNGVNGILADQMGLGKTVQSIGFLTHLKSKGINGPFMVIGPLSTLPNWVNEFERFAPTLPSLLYHGSPKEREALRRTRLALGPQRRVPEEFPVIVTSYEIVIADRKFLQHLPFKYIIVDEGHRLKNFNCKLLRELRQIPTANKLLLTGTPLQNNLSELWSLLNFLMPEVFNSLADFQSWFDFSSVVSSDGGDKAQQQELIAAEQRNRVISKLHAILKPFVLRRVKSDVEISLPQKQELILYAHMTEAQQQMNQQLLEGSLTEEMARIAREGGGNQVSVGKLNNVLMQLRKICNHPDLITSAFSQELEYPTPDVLVQQCGKLALLDRLLQRLHQRGHKVLIFSQMTSMLDLLQSYLEQQGHRACRIDGSIPWQARQQAIKDFNEDPTTWLFLLSTRAGGLGINLTAADTCIIYDSDWNPHQDLQAMDRCHRIGQTKPVLVFRLATANSVEGKMLTRANSKMALERLVIKKGAFKELGASSSGRGGGDGVGLSAGELLDLLRSGGSELDDTAQAGVVDDAMLEKLLDRSHLVACKPPAYPAIGTGYAMVEHDTGPGMLTTIN